MLRTSYGQEGNIQKKLARLWALLSFEEKEKLKKIAQIEKIKHETELKDIPYAMKKEWSNKYR